MIPRSHDPGPAPWSARPLILAVRLYQASLGQLVGGHCRFSPSCSEYAVEALRTHGALRGAWLTLRRLSRCHPLGPAGYDPVPKREEQNESGSVVN